VTHDGGPAFPVPEGYDYSGMTLREYYAGLAMASLIKTRTVLTAAEDAVELADALLKQLGYKDPD